MRKSKKYCVIEVSCHNFEGIDAVKAVLSAGEATGSEEFPIKIKLVVPFLHVVTTTSLQKESGIEALNEALDVVKRKLSSGKESTCSRSIRESCQRRTTTCSRQ